VHADAPPISLLDARWMPPELGLGDMWVGVRPEDARIASRTGDGSVPGVVTDVLRVPLGSTALVTLRVGKHDVHVQVPADERHAPGQEASLTLARYHVFDKTSGLRLGSGGEMTSR
jgi:ABC-type sugar transport system ATPase subunit